jgi:hypothetical protein
VALVLTDAGPRFPCSFGAWRPYMAPLTKNVRLTADSHFQETRHLEFDLRGSGLERWQPGAAPGCRAMGRAGHTSPDGCSVSAVC